MKTAVDSSVLLDVLSADPRFGEASRQALRAAHDAGALIACEVVWAEVRAHFPEDPEFRETMDTLGVRFDSAAAEVAELAGALWRSQRQRATGSGRRRVMADFLVGAHARLKADQLLTRDRGFYRGVFSELRVVDPTG